MVTSVGRTDRVGTMDGIREIWNTVSERMRYRIYMNDGEIFNVPNDESIDLDAIAKARWMEI